MAFLYKKHTYLSKCHLQVLTPKTLMPSLILLFLILTLNLSSSTCNIHLGATSLHLHLHLLLPTSHQLHPGYLQELWTGHCCADQNQRTCPSKQTCGDRVRTAMREIKRQNLNSYHQAVLVLSFACTTIGSKLEPCHWVTWNTLTKCDLTGVKRTKLQYKGASLPKMSSWENSTTGWIINGC